MSREVQEEALKRENVVWEIERKSWGEGRGVGVSISLSREILCLLGVWELVGDKSA